MDPFDRGTDVAPVNRKPPFHGVRVARNPIIMLMNAVANGMVHARNS